MRHLWLPLKNRVPIVRLDSLAAFQQAHETLRNASAFAVVSCNVYDDEDRPDTLNTFFCLQTDDETHKVEVAIVSDDIGFDAFTAFSDWHKDHFPSVNLDCETPRCYYEYEA